MPNSRASFAFCSPAAARCRSSAASVGRERLFAAPVSTTLLGERDALALPFVYQGSLELGEGSHDGQHQVRHRRILAREGQVFLDELYADTALCQLLHQPAQVIEVARQSIHAVHHYGVALAHEGRQHVELRSLRVLARCFVGEHFVGLDMLKLSFWILIEAADPYVADALTVQDVLLTEVCQEDIYDP